MPKMTIAQALRRIKKLKGHFAETQARASLSVVWQEGTVEHAFPFNQCIEEMRKTREELIRLRSAVTVANATNSIEYGGQTLPLCLAIKKLEEIKSEISFLQSLKVRASEKEVETTTEWKYADDLFEKRIAVEKKTSFQCFLPEAKRAAQVTALQDEFERLNDLLESANHTTLISG